MSLISVKEATSIVLNHSQDFGDEMVPLSQSLCRILKELIVADRDFPPFDRVSMDGIAICKASFDIGLRSFFIVNIQAAGSEQLSLKNIENCMEAMTGAILPKNTNAVIPYEQITIENGIATINLDEVNHFKNVHPQGFDQQKGTLLIDKNTKIGASEIGILATVGKNMVKVGKLPKIAIISTGDELVNVDEIPKSYQIRKSNSHTLAALLAEMKLESTLFHLKDNQVELFHNIKNLLKEFDVLLFSGGVSKGKFDYLPEVLTNLAVEKLFHSVQQKPGKPFWFGKKEHTTIFAFPGNPVATFLNFIKYFKPWYYKSMGLNVENQAWAVLEEDFIFKANLTYFLQVKISNKNGTLFAKPIMGNGSADLVNLIAADGFLELNAEQTEFKKGSVLPYLPYR
ncbi:MAG: molybdopterin molybdotransferase MoeA, partial [Flavobacteriaceae bacterium]|nr:molybdopterin molybdotransferase MoeA [Flavobacteriaceae bacterium]